MKTAASATAVIALALGLATPVLVSTAAGHAAAAAKSTRMTVSQVMQPSGTTTAVVTITGKRMTAMQKLAVDIRETAQQVALRGTFHQKTAAQG